MILQELLFPNFDTCAKYDMYFRMSDSAIDEIFDDMDIKKNERRYKDLPSHSRVYYDPQERAVHLGSWQHLEFDTYFNGFSIAKWRKYTRLDNLRLRLELKGSFHVRLSNKYVITFNACENVFFEQVCRASERTAFEFDIPFRDMDRGTVTFRLDALEGEDNVYYGGAYLTDVDEAALNPVNIAIDICTFRRERFVERNVDLINRDVIHNAANPLCGHLDVFISDNGRTLDAEKLQSDRVHVFPNKNVGGAGGFARGMIEALDMSDRRPFTHVLVMDDDVLINIDALLRTYRLLQFIRPEYAGKTVAGAMLRLDVRHIQHECGGQWEGNFVLSCRTFMDLTRLEDVLRNENENLLNYNAWWYSCIPISKISNSNLPMPIFIRYDDVEYGLRTGSDIIFMNGICLWHEPFEFKYSVYMEYYHMRNALIVNALHKPDYSVKYAVGYLKSAVKVNLARYRYVNCEMFFRAVEDFCKGPDFLMKTDAEALHREIMASVEKPCALDKLDVRYDETAYLNSLKRERIYKRTIRYVTLNKLLLPRGGVSVVDAALNGVKDFAGKDKVLNYIMGSNTGFVTAYSFSSAVAVKRKMRRVIRLLKAKHAWASEAYRQAMPQLTSRAFWDKYLNLK